MKTQEDNLTAGEYVSATVAAVWLLIGAVVAGAFVGGCKSIEVNKRPQTALTWTDTNGVVRLVLDKADKPVILDGGWEVDYFQHWMWTKLDTLNATAGTGVTLSLNGYESGVDSNLVALVSCSRPRSARRLPPLADRLPRTASRRLSGSSSRAAATSRRRR